MEKKLAPHIVLCHGLNNSPSVMNDLHNFFKNEGFVCSNITLKGHGDKIEHIEEDDWIQDIKTAYNDMPSAAPKFFCGFSIACLTHHISTQQHDLNWDFSWYISPALKLKPLVSAMKLPGIFPRLKLPSFAPKEYRAHRFLPCNYYNILLKLKQKVDMSQLKQTHILMSPKDEVVSYKKSLKLKPDHVELTAIKGSKVRFKDSYHLIPPHDLLLEKDKQLLESSIKKDLKGFTF